MVLKLDWLTRFSSNHYTWFKNGSDAKHIAAKHEDICTTHIGLGLGLKLQLGQAGLKPSDSPARLHQVNRHGSSNKIVTWSGGMSRMLGILIMSYSLKEVINSYVLHSFWTSQNCSYLYNQMTNWDGVRIKIAFRIDKWLKILKKS